MKRRQFIAGLGSAAAWPRAARTQQRTVPIIGFLHSVSPETRREFVSALRRGLAETGFVEGRNVRIEYRWAEDHNDRLPALAAELVNREVAVLIAASTEAALTAKAASQAIPLVFLVGVDPVEAGLVSSLARPGGNVTGIVNLLNGVLAKRLELLHEMVPAATSVALLVNPTNQYLAKVDVSEAQAAARVLGINLLIFNVSSQSEIGAAIAKAVTEHAGAFIAGSDSFFSAHADYLAMLAARHAVPTIYAYREDTLAGGLMSYGTDLVDAYRQVGIYTGRILNGEKPADLPVQQSVKLELVINMKTAKALGLTVPQSILLRADEVIE